VRMVVQNSCVCEMGMSIWSMQHSSIQPQLWCQILEWAQAEQREVTGLPHSLQLQQWQKNYHMMCLMNGQWNEVKRVK